MQQGYVLLLESYLNFKPSLRLTLRVAKKTYPVTVAHQPSTNPNPYRNFNASLLLAILQLA